jgi:GDPmannose 4,6-dehydratase
MDSRTALITGLSGQDGSYLAEFLVARGYRVHGLSRPGERLQTGAAVSSTEVDIESAEAVRAVVGSVRPDECYHLAAQTFVPGAEIPTVRTNVNGTLHVLEALRHEAPSCRVFLAGSSEMFGRPTVSPQDEQTPFQPRNVYGAAKVAAYHLLRVYRQDYGMFACCGFLYNHESPRRGPWFVTRKITQAAARIQAGQQTELRLGNLDTIRDWGHARDYVRAMWLMLQRATPDDYVIATGRGRTVREFVHAAFTAVGLDWQRFVHIDPAFYRPAEEVPLVGCPAKAREQLGWDAETPFAQLVKEMVDADMTAALQPK